MMLLEAFLGALIVASALLVFAQLTRPVATQEAPQDLQSFANDVLVSVSQRPGNTDGWLAEQTTAALGGSAPDLVTYLDEATPPGTRYQVRLSNGYGDLRLIPSTDTGRPPLAAQGGTAIIVPDWRAHSGIPVATLTPGEAYAIGANQCISSPSGHTALPDGTTTWISKWNTTVPLNAPYGLWSLHLTSDCSGAGTLVRVAHAGNAADRPPYLLHLVVWTGA